MSDAAKVNFSCQRNEDLGPYEARHTDADGQPTDMTGWSFELRIAIGLGLAPVLVVGSAPGLHGSYVSLLEPDQGTLELFIAKEDIAGLPGQPEDTAILFYDLVSHEADGTRRSFWRGRFIVEPAVGMFEFGGGLLVTENQDQLVEENAIPLRF